jgi:hypothetical protein
MEAEDLFPCSQDSATGHNPKPDESSPHSVYWKSTLILSSYLRLCLLSGLLPSGFPVKILLAFLISFIIKRFTSYRNCIIIVIIISSSINISISISIISEAAHIDTVCRRPIYSLYCIYLCVFY